MLGTGETQLEVDKNLSLEELPASEGVRYPRGNLHSNKARPEQRYAPIAVGGSHYGGDKGYPEGVLKDKYDSNRWAMGQRELEQRGWCEKRHRVGQGVECRAAGVGVAGGDMGSRTQGVEAGP